MIEKNYWIDGMMGLIVGDALGVPVQFLPRDVLRKRNKGLVTGMESGGAYDTPAGTWSDDSSMAIAALDSFLVKESVDYDDIMKRFVAWETRGMYTQYGKAFDQGATCMDAIYKYMEEGDPDTCGGTDEYSNGNGGLMRILPACLLCRNCESEEKAVNIVEKVTGLTHNHMRAKIGSVIYYFMVREIICCRDEKSSDLIPIIKKAMSSAILYYEKRPEATEELQYYSRMFHPEAFQKEEESKIRSTGYVVDSLEAAVWCLINTASYRECMLKAVNLGFDTDSVAAIAGGLAGLVYGYKDIPKEWLQTIRKIELVEVMCLDMQKKEENAKIIIE